MTEATMNDLLVRIATDPELVKEIQADPGLLTTRYGLSSEEAARVAVMRIDSRSAPPRQLEERLSRSGGAFGSIVAAAAQTAEHDSGGESMDYGADEEPQSLVSYESASEPEAAEPETPEPSMESEAEPPEMASPSPSPVAPELNSEIEPEMGSEPEMAPPSPSPGVEPELDETEPDDPEMDAETDETAPAEPEPEPGPEMDSPAPSPQPPTMDAEAIHARVDQALSGAFEGRGIELPPEVQANLSRAITDVLVGLKGGEPEPAGETEPEPAPGTEPEPVGETPEEPEVDPARTTTAIEKDADGNELRMTTTYDADGNLLDVTSVKTQTTLDADGKEVRIETTSDRTGGTQVHHHADGSTDTYHLSRDGIITHLGSTEAQPEPPAPAPAAETEPGADETRTTTELRKDADGNEIRITTTYDAEGNPVDATRSQTVLDGEGNEIRVETTNSIKGFTQVQHNLDGSKDIYEVSRDGIIKHTNEPAPHAPGSVEPAEHVPGTPLPKETSGISAR